jgi:hypothetical protein
MDSRALGVHSRSWSTTRPHGRNAGSLLVALPGWSVPGNNEHCPCGAAKHTLSDRTLSETQPTPPPVRSKYDEVGFPRIRMQHDDASWIAVLLDGPNGDALALCTFPQAGQKFEAFPLVP